MLGEFEDNVTVGAGSALTVILIDEDADPLKLPTVIEYLSLVFKFGIVMVPCVDPIPTNPVPLLDVTDVADVDVQVKVSEPLY